MSSIEQQSEVSSSEVFNETQTRSIRSVAPSASEVFKSSSGQSIKATPAPSRTVSKAYSAAPQSSSAGNFTSSSSAYAPQSSSAANFSSASSAYAPQSSSAGNFSASSHYSVANNAAYSAASSYAHPVSSYLSNSTAFTRSTQQAAVPGKIATDLLELLKSGQPTPAPARTASQRSNALLSEIEAAILRSGQPIDSNEQEEIEVLGQRGLWLNKQEILNWRGVIPITEYLINEDANPEIITKRSQEKIEYIQELAIRYLRPPTPPAPGEIVIKQEANICTPPAPPLVIRQQPARPSTPEPLVIREAPPPAPEAVGRKIITISGKRLPPPPRKVVIERLAALPSKPQSVLIERWLPYAEVKRRVIFQGAPPDPVCCKPRNVIVQWEAPQVVIRKEFKYLGVVRANPADYVATYGAQLKLSQDLPDFVFEVKTPEGLVLAADYKPASFHELEGDLHALKLVNLEQEGLGIYRDYLVRLGVLEGAAANLIQASASFSASSASVAASASAAASVSALNDLITQIFRTIDTNNNGRINVEDAEKTLLRLNSRLGRRYGEDDVRAFFSALDVNNDGSLDLEEFRKAFMNVAQ